MICRSSTGLLAVLGLACAEARRPAGAPAPTVSSTPEEGAPRERLDLLWTYDLSDGAVERTTVDGLWEIGVACLSWPPDVPEGTTKDDVVKRLMEAKYRYVGDFIDEDGDLEPR